MFMRGKNGVFWITVSLVFILVFGSVASIADFDDNDLQSSEIVSEPERGQCVCSRDTACSNSH